MPRPIDNNPDLSNLLDQNLGWNTAYDAMTRGAKDTAQQIYAVYNDYDCHKIAQAVLAAAMQKPLPQIVTAATAFDDEIRKLLGMSPA
jgi:hypothetical protein